MTTNSSVSDTLNADLAKDSRGSEGDKIIDYISGQMVEAGPEEVETTQPFSKLLVEDYGYPPNTYRRAPNIA